MNLFLVVKADDITMRLCSDRRWRHFALLESVKVYRTERGAAKKAHRCGGVVAAIPAEYTMDICGRVYDESEKERPMSEFVKVVP